MSGFDDESSSERRPRKARHVSIDLPIKEDMHARHVQQLAKMVPADALVPEIAALNYPNKFLSLDATDEDTQAVEAALNKLGIGYKRTEAITLEHRGIHYGYAVDALQVLQVLQADTTKRAWIKCKNHEEKEKGKEPEVTLTRRTVPLMEGERVKLVDLGFMAADALGIPRHKPASEHFPATDFGWISRDLEVVEKEIAVANGEDPDAAGATTTRRTRRSMRR